jgi:hypothetical protein
MSVGRQQGACPAAHRDALVPGLKEVRRDAMDNVALSKVRQQGAEPRSLPPQDVLPRARRPQLQVAAVARRIAAQTMQARRRDEQL